MYSTIQSEYDTTTTTTDDMYSTVQSEYDTTTTTTDDMYSTHTCT